MRRIPALTVTALLALTALTACGEDSPSAQDPAQGPASTPAAQGSCAWVSNGESSKKVTPPGADARPTAAQAAMETNRGTITFSLDLDSSPCTTLNLQSLAEQHYFDDTICHRLTVDPSLSVLQCGDPTGTGTGGPGYTIPDELTSAQALADSPLGDGVKTYPAGTVAMAKTAAPDSGGSQFFLVYADSVLPPEYTVFGTMDKASLAVVQEVAKGGVAADGTAPADSVEITTLTTS